MRLVKENGHFDLEQIERYFKYIKDGVYYLEVSNKKPNRSNKQNRYYHGVIVSMLSKELGYTTHEMKLVLRKQFLGYKTETINNEEIKYLISTSDLNVTEMEDFLTSVRIFFIDKLQITIPLPNEVITDY